jgi:methylenetetrahydrofolate reductase (NADPH)
MNVEPVRLSRFMHVVGARHLQLSFEFFPPSTEEMEKALWEAIRRLEPLAPNFVSVTYGAGGSTRERTHATVQRLLTETRLVPAAHLTCIGATRSEIDAIVARYYVAGVYANAADLAGGIKRRYPDIEVSVSAYPEKHPNSPSVEADIDMLKAKVDAGATRAMTQFFFENDLYFRYLDRVRARGIEIPIVPGILPVQNFRQIRNFAQRAGTSVPRWLAHRFEGLDDDPVTRRLIAAGVAAEQVLDLVDRGITDFHFYTMNRADLVYAICHLLGIRPAKADMAQ